MYFQRRHKPSISCGYKNLTTDQAISLSKQRKKSRSTSRSNDKSLQAAKKAGLQSQQSNQMNWFNDYNPGRSAVKSIRNKSIVTRTRQNESDSDQKFEIEQEQPNSLKKVKARPYSGKKMNGIPLHSASRRQGSSTRQRVNQQKQSSISHQSMPEFFVKSEDISTFDIKNAKIGKSSLGNIQNQQTAIDTDQSAMISTQSSNFGFGTAQNFISKKNHQQLQMEITEDFDAATTATLNNHTATATKSNHARNINQHFKSDSYQGYSNSSLPPIFQSVPQRTNHQQYPQTQTIGSDLFGTLSSPQTQTLDYQSYPYIHLNSIYPFQSLGFDQFQTFPSPQLSPMPYPNYDQEYHKVQFINFWKGFIQQHEQLMQADQNDLDFELIKATEKQVKEYFQTMASLKLTTDGVGLQSPGLRESSAEKTSNSNSLKPHYYLHSIFKMLAYHYNRKQSIEESLFYLEESNAEGLQISSEEINKGVMISILENYLNIAHAQQHLKVPLKALQTLTEALALGYMILKQEDTSKKCLYSQRIMNSNLTRDSEYLVSLIADCHKQKYDIMNPRNSQAALAELKQALKTAKQTIPQYQHSSNMIINDLQRHIDKHQFNLQKQSILHPSASPKLKCDSSSSLDAFQNLQEGESSTHKIQTGKQSNSKPKKSEPFMLTGGGDTFNNSNGFDANERDESLREKSRSNGLDSSDTLNQRTEKSKPKQQLYGTADLMTYSMTNGGQQTKSALEVQIKNSHPQRQATEPFEQSLTFDKKQSSPKFNRQVTDNSYNDQFVQRSRTDNTQNQRTIQGIKNADISLADFNERSSMMKESSHDTTSFNDRASASDLLSTENRKLPTDNTEKGVKSSDRSVPVGNKNTLKSLKLKTELSDNQQVSQKNQVNLFKRTPTPKQVQDEMLQTSLRQNSQEDQVVNKTPKEIQIPKPPIQTADEEIQNVIDIPLKIEVKEEDPLKLEVKQLLEDFLKRDDLEAVLKDPNQGLLHFEQYLQKQLNQRNILPIPSSIQQQEPPALMEMNFSPINNINADKKLSSDQLNGLSYPISPTLSVTPSNAEQVVGTSLYQPPQKSNLKRFKTLRNPAQLHSCIVKIQAMFRGYMARQQVKFRAVTESTDQVILDTFIIHYIEALEDQQTKRLYFKVKIMWLKTKKLLKILLKDEITKKSNYLMEKMPAEIAALQNYHEMADAIKKNLSVLRNANNVAGKGGFRYTLHLTKSMNRAQTKLWTKEVKGVSFGELTNAQENQIKMIETRNQREIGQTQQKKQRNDSLNSSVNSNSHEMSSTLENGGAIFDPQQRLKLIKKKTLKGARKQFANQSHQKSGAANTLNMPHLRQQKRAFKMRKIVSTHRLNHGGHAQTDNPSVCFKFKPELTCEQAASIIQTQYRLYRVRKAFKKYEEKINAEKSPKKKKSPEIKSSMKSKKSRGESPKKKKKKAGFFNKLLAGGASLEDSLQSVVKSIHEKKSKPKISREEAALRIQSQFRKNLAKKIKFEVMSRENTLTQAKLKLGTIYFHIKLVKEDESYYISARNVMLKDHSYKLLIAKQSIIQFIENFSTDEKLKVLFNFLEYDSNESTLSLKDDLFIQEELPNYQNLRQSQSGSLASHNLKQKHISMDASIRSESKVEINNELKKSKSGKQKFGNLEIAQKSAALIQKVIRQAYMKRTNRIVTFSKWIKDKADEYKISFQTFTQSNKDDDDSDEEHKSEKVAVNITDKLESLELIIYDASQKRTIVSKTVSFEEYKRIINLAEDEFTKTIMHMVRVVKPEKQRRL